MDDGKDPREYEAHCHCGKVRLKFVLGSLETTSIIACNCSICVRNGYLLVYPRQENVEIVKGEAELSSYVFGTKDRPHRFCRNCGSSMLVDFSQTSYEVVKGRTAINIRMVPGIEDELARLEPLFKRFDGKRNFQPAYSVEN